MKKKILSALALLIVLSAFAPAQARHYKCEETGTCNQIQ